MNWYKVFVNHAELDAIRADSYGAAVKAARALYGRRCDVIGGK